MSDAQTHEGSCHCGAVTFEVDTSLDGLIECNCSHCYRKGFVLAFAPRAAFRLKSGEAELGEYRFNKHAIAHQFCKSCGVQPFGYGAMPDGTETVAVNVRTMTDIEPWAWTAERVDGRSSDAGQSATAGTKASRGCPSTVSRRSVGILRTRPEWASR